MQTKQKDKVLIKTGSSSKAHYAGTTNRIGKHRGRYKVGPRKK